MAPLVVLRADLYSLARQMKVSKLPVSMSEGVEEVLLTQEVKVAVALYDSPQEVGKCLGGRYLEGHSYLALAG